MLIDEAIEILERYTKRGHSELYQKRIEAEKLGIEALKRIKYDRKLQPHFTARLLRGERDESEPSA